MSELQPVPFCCGVGCGPQTVQKRIAVRPDGPPSTAEPVSTTLDTRLDPERDRPQKSSRRRQTDRSVVACCSMARVGHSAMTAEELTENIEAAVKVVGAKIRMVSVVGRVLRSFTWMGLEIFFFFLL